MKHQNTLNGLTNKGRKYRAKTYALDFRGVNNTEQVWGQNCNLEGFRFDGQSHSPWNTSFPQDFSSYGIQLPHCSRMRDKAVSLNLKIWGCQSKERWSVSSDATPCCMIPFERNPWVCCSRLKRRSGSWKVYPFPVKRKIVRTGKNLQRYGVRPDCDLDFTAVSRDEGRVLNSLIPGLSWTGYFPI